jgi:hypothetical protein
MLREADPMRRALIAVLALVAAALPAARAQEQAPTPAPSIGTATMLPDGTIVLDLRADGPQGQVGHGRLLYRPSHPDHAAVLRHLGGLRPGEQKPVPPWD